MKMKRILAIAAISALFVTACGVSSLAIAEKAPFWTQLSVGEEAEDHRVFTRMVDLLLEEVRERLLCLTSSGAPDEDVHQSPSSFVEESVLSCTPTAPDEEQDYLPSIEETAPVSESPCKEPSESFAEEPLPSAAPSAEEQEELTSAPLTTSDAVLAYEQEVVRLVNEERIQRGLAPLTYSAELSDGAREKSFDMREKGYFSHQSPTYGSPFEQMRARGISYSSAGENIAMGYTTPEAVVTAWMNSEGHRANILSARFTEIGVGYVEEGNYCTQWFKG